MFGAAVPTTDLLTPFCVEIGSLEHAAMQLKPDLVRAKLAEEKDEDDGKKRIIGAINVAFNSIGNMLSPQTPLSDDQKQAFKNNFCEVMRLLLEKKPDINTVLLELPIRKNKWHIKTMLTYAITYANMENDTRLLDIFCAQYSDCLLRSVRTHRAIEHCVIHHKTCDHILGSENIKNYVEALGNRMGFQMRTYLLAKYEEQLAAQKAQADKK